jgi:sigma54-dependent transcription regulator
VGIEPWQGCMVRLSDKVTRLETFNRTGKLRHETVEDTLIDLAAYALLALTLYREENDRPAAADCR